MRGAIRSVLVLAVATLTPLPAPAAEGSPGEARHLANVRQLTFGGQNAEAYFSRDGKRIVFQSTRPPFACDQIHLMDPDGGSVRLLSTGRGATTCAFLHPSGERFLFASTHLAGPDCPPPPDRSGGYVWPLHPGYDIFSAPLAAPGDLVRLTDTPGYDAEAAYSPDGRTIVFTSVRDGDLDLYLMNADGSGVRRLTDKVGLDGGAFFSWDGRHIVYRSWYPEGEEEAEYRRLLARNLLKPTRAEIWIMDADGGNRRQVTATGDANWAPFLHPDNRTIIFSSNQHARGSGAFSLYTVKVDGSGPERITFDARFDSFPMFSPDGTKLIWASTRNGSTPREFNVFTADWIP
jgi:Tol biopolymer transport system component